MTEKEEFEAILDVFTSEGWKYILEDTIKKRDAIDNIYGLDTLEQLWKRKGELQELNSMIGLQEWYQRSYELHEALK